VRGSRTLRSQRRQRAEQDRRDNRNTGGKVPGKLQIPHCNAPTLQVRDFAMFEGRERVIAQDHGLMRTFLAAIEATSRQRAVTSAGIHWQIVLKTSVTC
jgi:hypothetical protein